MIKLRKQHFYLIFCLLFFAVFFTSKNYRVRAAVLSFDPSSETHYLGNLFDVSVFLDTEGENVNAIKTKLSFPYDKLEVVEVLTGQFSASPTWINLPSYDNENGAIFFEGVFVNGINTAKGLISKIKFRVKKIGLATINFYDNSKILLNNGRGENCLKKTYNGNYNLMLPPSDGPTVNSESHPEQSSWYNKSEVILNWVDVDLGNIDGYSYILNDNSLDIPDDILDGSQKTKNYKNLSDGQYYFHIKALNKNKIWSKTSHFSFKIDTKPPKEFSLEVSPHFLSSEKKRTIIFDTEDDFSGIDYYELMVVSLKKKAQARTAFFEISSPFVSQELDYGKYDVIVRAYDKAGNYRDSKEDFNINKPFLRFIRENGIIIGNNFIIPWNKFILLIILLNIALLFLFYKVLALERKISINANNYRSHPFIKKKIQELEEIKKKYKKFLIIIILIMGCFLILKNPAKAQENLSSTENSLISFFSSNISNNEKFYVGGDVKTDEEKILLYFKNLKTEKVYIKEIEVNNPKQWFYQHDKCLSEGDYIFWIKSNLNKQFSLESPQFKITVKKNAFEIGDYRLDYKTVFSFIAVFFLLTFFILIFFIVIYIKKIRKKIKLFYLEIEKIENILNRNFLILYKEINEKLTNFSKKNNQINKNGKKLSNNIKKIEHYIKKEVLKRIKLLD